MNCDDFLTAQETGGYFARLRARRHAARCPRCAALRASFAPVKQEWANPEPLSARARQLWKDAAREPARRMSPSRNWMVVTGLAAAACVVLLVFKLAGQRLGKVTPSPPLIVKVIPPLAVTESKVTVVNPAEELNELSAAVNQLDAELTQLRLKAERMDASRQVAMTLERYDKW